MAEDASQDLAAEFTAFKVNLSIILASHARDLASHARDIEYLKSISLPVMRRDINMTAADVFKWSIGKKAKLHGSSYSFTTQSVKANLKVGCVAFGRYGRSPSNADENDYQTIGAALIAKRNDIAHCSSIYDLDERVSLCQLGIQRYPELVTELPDACTIIQRYDEYKRLQPQLFT